MFYGKAFAAILISLSAALTAGAQDGTLDAGFGSGGIVVRSYTPYYDLARGMVLQADGKIVVAGNADDFPVAFRYKVDGTPDSTFGINGGTNIYPFTGVHYANAIALQADGKTVIAGRYVYDPVNRYNGALVTRLRTNGKIDSSFGTNGYAKINISNGGNEFTAVAIQADGKILAAGDAYLPGSTTSGDISIVRLKPDGTPDSTYGTNGFVTTVVSNHSDATTAITLQPDGRLLVLVDVQAPNTSVSYTCIYRYNTNGSVDNTFGSGGRIITLIQGSSGALNKASAITLQPDGKILITGFVAVTLKDIVVQRFNSNGSADATFGAGGTVTTDIDYEDAGTAILVQPDNKIVVAGTSKNLNTPNQFAVVRYYEDGQPDSSFGSNGIVLTRLSAITSSSRGDMPYAMLMQPDYKLLLAGAAFQDVGLVRYENSLTPPPPVPSAIQAYGASGLSITAYPNPAQDVLHLDYSLPQEGRVTIDLLNAAGQTLSAFTVNASAGKGRHSISLSHLNSLPAGGYFVVLRMATGRVVAPFRRM